MLMYSRVMCAVCVTWYILLLCLSDRVFSTTQTTSRLSVLSVSLEKQLRINAPSRLASQYKSEWRQKINQSTNKSAQNIKFN